MKTLIIAEKPDMGRNIAAAIEPRAINKRTHLEGQTYVITWAIGHLIGLAEPDYYDDRYKKWDLNDLPIIPDQFKLLPNEKTKSQLQVIKTVAADCNEIINACDAGREGQLIFSYIQQHLKLTQPVRRLWISDLTPETIRKGFAELKAGADYEHLTQAARSRSEADWLVGMNGSRAFTTKHGELLSVGRVQTPVLGLIYDRQREIESFDTQTYFEVEASFSQGELSYRGVWQGDRLHDKTYAESIRMKVDKQSSRIASYEVKDSKEFPFKLYDLTLLQREANARYGYPAKKTLDLAQALYEKHKVISYPRTNSNYVNEQNIPDMYAALEMLKGTAEYGDFARSANKSLVHKNNKYVCNPAKVEDHHAILPTKKRASGLSVEEQHIYDLVVRRFLSVFYAPAEYKIHTVMTDVRDELFKTTVKEQLSPGWKVLYPKKGDDEQEEVEINTPFAIDPDEQGFCMEAIVKEKATQPPKPFTEGTLLKAMETAGRQIEDEELRDAMKDCGLGTPATRAGTIERLKHVGYIAMQGKRITITPKGRSAIELIRGAGVTLLASPDMTGEWERRLSAIARGQASASTFMESVKTFTRSIVDKVREQPRAQRAAFAVPEAKQPAAGGAAKPGRERDAAGAATKTRKRTAGAPEAKAPGREQTASSGGATTLPTAQAAGEFGVADCPREGCGGRIFMGRKGYGCSHYKAGCSFVIWKQSFNKTLTNVMIRVLIEKGRTGKLKFQSDNGATFEAKIILKDRQTGRIELER